MRTIIFEQTEVEIGPTAAREDAVFDYISSAGRDTAFGANGCDFRCYLHVGSVWHRL